MDEQKEVQKNDPGFDTADQPAEGGRYIEGSASQHTSEHESERSSDHPAEQRQMRANTGGDELMPLFEHNATEKFRARWLDIQSRFVDDPSDAVKQADQLVEDVIQDVTRSFADRRGNLERHWKGGEQASTEDLRIALKQYRSFFDRLLTLES